MNKIKQIIKLIKKYDNISLFFHEYPDFDALGSCFGLKAFINKKYPEKHVHVVGINEIDKEVTKKFIKFNEQNVDDQFISKSLGIICDVATESRVYTQKHKLCKKTIRIDHHPHVDTFANVEWIDNLYSSACEMVATLIKEWDIKSLDTNSASYLYIGMVTDTNRFFYPCTTSHTLKIASKLSKILKNKCYEINQTLCKRTLEEIKIEQKIKSLIKYDLDNGIAYLSIPKNFFTLNKITPSSYIYTMSNIEGINIWMSLYFDEEKNRWKGSIRSIKEDISVIAAKFDGGGHKLASGFSLNDNKEFKLVIKEVISLLHN